MANVKINDLAVIADPASTDVLPIVDVTLDTTNKISIADILKTVPEGTAAAPAIAFEGDSNTGIYHPGSEQIGFATSGLGRVFIASDGSVGVGTTDPDELLHIRGDVAEFKGTNTNSIDVSVGTEQVFKFGIEGQKNAVFGPTGSIIFRQDGSTWSFVEPNLKPTRIEFCTQDSTTTDTSETPRLVVDQNGRVGIGTTNPLSLLNVSSPLLNTAETVASFGNTTIPNGLEIITNGNLEWGFNAKNSRNLTFRTNQIERARIDSGARLLVGTSTSQSVARNFGATSPSNIQVVLSSTFAAYSAICKKNDTSGPVLALASSRSDSIVNQDDRLGEIRFAGYDGTDYESSAALIKAEVDGTPGTNDMPGRLVFSTTADGESDPTERMRIKANGSILFADDDEAGITSGTVDGKSIEFGSIMRSSRASTVAAGHVAFYNPNGFVGQIFTSGSSTSYTTSSDYRLKDNVVPLANAADRVNQLQVHRFNFIADPDTTVDGFIAHEAQAVVPECATGTKDEVDDEGNPVYQGIDQSKLVPLLTAALQEALAEIETLKQRLDDAGI